MTDSDTKTEPLFSCPRFDVHQNEHGKHIVKAPNGVGIIALDAENRLLMTREYRPQLDKFMWRIPAGKAEENETFEETAHRELREESGFDARNMILFTSYAVDLAFVDRRLAIFEASDLFESPLDTGDELIAPEVHFMTAQEVLALLNDGQIIGDIAACLYRFMHVKKLI